jgi:hypothetical protein
VSSSTSGPFGLRSGIFYTADLRFPAGEPIVGKQIKISRTDLHEKVRTTPLKTFAKEFGLSDVGLAKLCRRHDIPLPGRGYWVRMQFGKEQEQTPFTASESRPAAHLWAVAKFVPPSQEIRTMRTYWRQRNHLVQSASRHIQRIQKTLTQMNLQLANVLSGVTGQAIGNAILAGERDPYRLAVFQDPRVQASEEQIARSLEGNWQEDLLFVQKQEQDGYEFLPEADGRMRSTA